jgi:hypothetical protein
MKGFSKLCTPARIYFSIAVIAAVVSLFYGATLMTEFMKLLFAFIWTFLLSFLCDKGFVSVSWFLVLLPYVLMLLAMLNIYHVSEREREILRAIKLQGAFGREPFGKIHEGATTMSGSTNTTGSIGLNDLMARAAQSKDVKDKLSKIQASVQDLLMNTKI